MVEALFVARLETRHFTFEGCGTSRRQAIDVLKQGLRAHGQQCQPHLPADWWETDDFNVTRYERGMALRDGTEI